MCRLIALKKEVLDEKMEKVNCFKLPVMGCAGTLLEQMCCWMLGKQD